MGHIRLGNLPKTQNWKQVVGLLDETDGPAQIAAATLDAAEKNFKQAPDDLGLAHAF